MRKNFTNKKRLIFLTILSFGISFAGFLHIPILSALGVDVFALRGILIFTALPVIAIFSIPFAYCIVLLFTKNNNEKKTINSKN
ncbi:MAG: hypothetical protein WCR30_04990 [Clostridia bacterium]